MEKEVGVGSLSDPGCVIDEIVHYQIVDGLLADDPIITNSWEGHWW